MQTCQTCEGKGKIPAPIAPDELAISGQVQTCPDCTGKGVIEE